jgi:xanthine dehydrogenase accessory factor
MLAEIAEQLRYDASTFVILVAHDYKFEVPVLRVVLAREPAYIGLLGNRKRGRAVLDFLAAEGISAEDLARVHVPVGLDIGAQTAPEIALSVLAEAVAVRNGRPGTSLRARAESV